ncbi:hypothetical protein OS493_011187 [Desmophyllum pertusum]|uniref:Kynurenine formamidase n=1 Tax=Desmophyllum pertusum TaxID=174260 RepID=A0A9W9Z1X3_9CNID|nr:hypothetical protein OS493_011187 [Desmophyllum pertusum]
MRPSTGPLPCVSKHTKVFANVTADGYYYSSYDISASEHGGTHLDAPSHFAEGKWTNADAQLTPSDLQTWEEKHGKIPDDVILLVFTDWGRRWPNKKTYLGSDTKNTSLLHFPGIHANASRWLVKNRNIKLVGIDTASIDYGQSTMFESHQILYKENIPGLENVAHMDKLPAKGFTVYAAPMFITGGSGGPCRIFARLDEDDNKDCTKSVGARFHSMFMFLGITFPCCSVFCRTIKPLLNLVVQSTRTLIQD